MVIFGTCAVETAVTIFAPSLAMPAFSYLRPTMKPVMFCRNSSGMARWTQSSMKWAPFCAALAEQNAIIGDDAHRRAVKLGEAGDERRAVARLEFVETRAVDDAGDDLAHVIGVARVGGNDPVNFLGVVKRRLAAAQREVVFLARLRLATMRRAMASAWASFSARWSATPERRVWTSAPPRSSAVTISPVAALHQRRAAEENRALIAHDDGFVRHGRHIGAARRAGAHHHRDLRECPWPTCWPG